MRQNFWACTLLLALVWISGIGGGAIGAEPVSAQDLAGLSQADRVAVMKTLLERRIDKVRNIDVTSETRIYNRKYSNGKLGDRIADSGWYQFHTRYCDGSYGVKSSWFVNQAATVADSTSVSHHNEKTGITRIVSQQGKRKGHQGRIGVEHLPSMHSNRVAFHLLGGSFVIRPTCDKCEFLLESLASCSDRWRVDVDVQEQQVIITHSYRIAFIETGTGTRKVYFNVAKGMLPVRIDVDYHDEWVTSLEPRRVTPVWREERIVMDEPRDFDGFWMPMRIEERIRSSTLGPEICSVRLTSVKQIVFGRVKEADLEVKFPPDTEVADTVKNVFYRTDANGNPKEPINPIGVPKGPIQLDPQGRLIQPRNASWMFQIGIWSIGCGVVLLPCVVILRRRLASSRAP
jgi:hypothetical protein